MSTGLLPVHEMFDDRSRRRRMTAAEWIDEQEFHAARDRSLWEDGWVDDDFVVEAPVDRWSQRRRH